MDTWWFEFFIKGYKMRSLQISLFWFAFLVFMILIVVFFFNYYVKLSVNKKGKYLRVLAITLISLEVIRMILQLTRYILLTSAPTDFTEFTVTTPMIIRAFSFTMCAMNVWIQSFLLLKNNDRLYAKYGPLILTIGSFAALPIILPYSFETINWFAIQTLVTHFLIGFIPFLLLRDRKFTIKYQNIIIVLVGLLVMSAIGYIASVFSGENFMYTIDLTEIYFFLPYIEFPLNIPILIGGYALAYCILVSGLKIYEKIKTILKPKTTKN